MQGFKWLYQRLESQVHRLEMLRLEEFIAYTQNWKRRLMHDFLSGVARGVGFSVGFTLLGAVILFLLKNAALANLPIIGRFLAELVRIVETNLQYHARFILIKMVKLPT